MRGAGAWLVEALQADAEPIDGEAAKCTLAGVRSSGLASSVISASTATVNRLLIVEQLVQLRRRKQGGVPPPK
jgi:hypothetical protein